MTHKIRQKSQRVEKLEIENERMKEKCTDLKTDCGYLDSLLQDEVDTELKLYSEEDQSFTCETVICVQKMIDSGVAFAKIPGVMQCVAELCGKTSIDRLPKESTIRNFTIQRITLSQMQIGEAVSEQPNLTLYSDETARKGTKYMGYHVSDEEGQMWLLGLRQMANKKASTTLDTFKEILHDTNRVCQRLESKNETQYVGYKIMKNITATMSDQAATEKSFNALLASFKLEILPEVEDNWDSLSDEERENCAQISNFFCGLHLLINMAEFANKALKTFEEAADMSTEGAAGLKYPKLQKYESGIVRLIRTACKAFCRGADEKSGAYEQFRTYIESEKREKFKLATFAGNRFNILFFDASQVYYYASSIVYFLEQVHATPNFLLQSVLADCKSQQLLAGVRAPGLIEKFVTSPLWRLLEEKGHILDLNIYYLQLKLFLERASQNCISFMSGEDVPFPEYLAEEDNVLSCLLKTTGHDHLTQQMLQMIFTSWVCYVERATKDHLPGGQFACPTESL